MSITVEELANWVRRYYHNPVLFVREVLQQSPDSWQADLMRAVARGDKRVTVRSGHRVGKSTVLSWIALWYMLTRNEFKIGVTAPTSGQLEDAFYAELRKWVVILGQRAPALASLLEVKSDKIDLVASRGVSFLTIKTGRIETPEALAGLHSLNTLLIVDEASGVPDPVFESATGSMAGENSQMLCAGNPLRSTGFFAATHLNPDLAPFWTRFHVSSVDCTRVSRTWIEEKKAEYGEESNSYRARVLGEFPRGDDDTVISVELAMSAVGRAERHELADDGSPLVWGLDVARFGHNASALCRRKGRIIPLPVTLYRGLDTMQLVGRVHGEFSALPKHLQPVEICVDAVGVGGGPVDRMRELGLPVRAINVGESPSIDNAYFNLRSQGWHMMKAWLQQRDTSLPKDDRLLSDLTRTRFDYTEGRSDKIKVETKKAMKQRGVPSPDAADAMMLTFLGTAATANGPQSGGWHGPPPRRSHPGVTWR